MNERTEDDKVDNLAETDEQADNLAETDKPAERQQPQRRYSIKDSEAVVTNWF